MEIVQTIIPVAILTGLAIGLSVLAVFVYRLGFKAGADAAQIPTRLMAGLPAFTQPRKPLDPAKVIKSTGRTLKQQTKDIDLDEGDSK
jgi:hypothetical protein